MSKVTEKEMETFRLNWWTGSPEIKFYNALVSDQNGVSHPIWYDSFVELWEYKRKGYTITKHESYGMVK